VADRKVTVKVDVAGNTAGLNAALAKSQQQTAKLTTAIQGVGKASAGAKIKVAAPALPKIAPPPRVPTIARPPAVPTFAASRPALPFAPSSTPAVTPTPQAVSPTQATALPPAGRPAPVAAATAGAVPIPGATVGSSADATPQPAIPSLTDSIQQAASLNQSQATARLAWLRSPMGQQAEQQQAVGAANVHAEETRRRLAYVQSDTGGMQARRQLGVDARIGNATAQQRLDFSGSETGRQTGHIGEQLAASQRAIDADKKLAFLRSGPGAQATVAAIRGETQLAKQQQYIGRVAAIGRVGAGIERFQESAQPVFRGAQVGAAVSGGLVAAGVASLPIVSEQLTNSFSLLTREIGISVIPGVVRMSGWFQSAARTFRSVNEHTGGMLGSGLFYGSLGLGAVGLGGKGLSMARDAAGGLSWGARALGFGADVAGNAAGNAVGRAGGRVAARAGGSAAGNAAGGAGAAIPFLASNPIGWAIGATIAAGVAGSAQAARVEENRAAGERPGFGSKMLSSILTGGIPDSWAAKPWQWLTGSGPAGGGGAAGGGTGPMAMFNPQGQAANSFEALYDRMLVEGISSTAAETEQQARAYERMINALNQIAANTGSAGVAYTPEAP
jgi:hypothetical protein